MTLPAADWTDWSTLQMKWSPYTCYRDFTVDPEVRQPSRAKSRSAGTVSHCAAHDGNQQHIHPLCSSSSAEVSLYQSRNHPGDV